jgi:nucleotide-binding universal stress UspA family protein
MAGGAVSRDGQWDFDRGVPLTGTIICAVDDPARDDVVQVAGELAEEADARVLLVHVRPDPKLDGSQSERERQRHRALRLGADVLDRAQRSLPGEVEVHARVLLGPTVEQLTAIARDEAAQLMVVGASRRGPIASVLFANVSRILSREAPCSLVIVPEERGSAVGVEQTARAA